MVRHCESLVTECADDTLLTLDGTHTSLRESIEVFDAFYHVPGLKINNSKTRIVLIGCKKYSDHFLCADTPLF